MSDNSDLHKIDVYLPDMTKSIFPVFNVNVPMPADTAVPGSYGGTAVPGSGQNDSSSSGNQSK